jgi:hypothetical protein
LSETHAADTLRDDGPWKAARGLTASLRARLADSRLARAYDALTLAVVVVVHHVLGLKHLRAAMGFDERYFIHQGWSVTKGLVPYRDFQEFKPPMIFFVNALGIGLFGLDGLAYRHIFSILSLLMFAAVTVALLTRKVSRLLVASLLVLMIDHFYDRVFHDFSINNAETLGLDFFVIACGVLLTRTPWQRTRDVAGGAVLALAPLSKEPLAFAVALAWVTFLFVRRAEDPRPDAARRFAKLSIAGAAGVAALWLLYMLATRSLGWYLVQLKLNLEYTKNYAQQLNWFPKNPPGGELAEYWRRIRAAYVNAPHFTAFVPFFAAALALGDRRWRTVGVAALATFFAGLYAVTIGKGFANHYYIMAMTGTFFLATVGALAIERAVDAAGAAALGRWVGVATAAVAALTVWPRFAEEWSKTYGLPAAPVSRAEVDFVRAHSAPGDRIWTLGDPLLYVFADRPNACREGIVIDELIQYHPGRTDEERLRDQREELRQQRPKLVVFGDDPVNYQRKQRYIKALATPFLRENGYIKLNDKFYARP